MYIVCMYRTVKYPFLNNSVGFLIICYFSAFKPQHNIPVGEISQPYFSFFIKLNVETDTKLRTLFSSYLISFFEYFFTNPVLALIILVAVK